MKNNQRYICLDTETTGTSINKGHRIIEIGCVEIINGEKTGKEYHTFLHPDREIDKEAEAVHGITLEKLKDAPKFSGISQDFLNFIQDSTLIIHNAPFDVTFINNELKIVNLPKITNEIIDTLILARKKYIGERASLDALCKKFEIDTTSRTLHGALLDAQLLAEVFLKIDKEMEVHLQNIKYITENNPIRENYNSINFIKLYA